MFTVKAIHVPSRYKTAVCMKEWNRGPIGWLSYASPKAHGQEPVASCWTGRLCAPILVSG